MWMHVPKCVCVYVWWGVTEVRKNVNTSTPKKKRQVKEHHQVSMGIKKSLRIECVFGQAAAAAAHVDEEDAGGDVGVR